MFFVRVCGLMTGIGMAMRHDLYQVCFVASESVEAKRHNGLKDGHCCQYETTLNETEAGQRVSLCH